MKFFVMVMLMTCSFFIGIQCMHIVHQVKCFSEENCGTQFSEFLNAQKRIFAQAADENQSESSIREEGKDGSFYYNLDHSIAPGFGMSILFDENNEEGINNKEKDNNGHGTIYIGDIYYFSKIDKDHTEKALLEELILDLSFKNDMKKIKKGKTLSPTKKI